MSRAYDEVVLEFSHLNNGDTSSGNLCPSCKGGGSGETSMSVGRHNDWLWWRCHRASCGFKGSYSHKKFRESWKRPDPSLNRLSFSREELPKCVLDMLCEKLHLTEGLILSAGWEWTENYGGRVIMPILSFEGAVIGHTLRSYDTSNTPKALVNRTTDAEQVCWYRISKYPSKVIIVEDQPSALRISGERGMCGLALIGTSLNHQRCREIKASRINKIALCLDKDAANVAIKHLINFRSILPSMKIIQTDKDVKDMDEQEFVVFTQNIMEAL